MKRVVITAALALSLWASKGEAQVVVVPVDISKAQIAWQWAPGTAPNDSMATGYKVKCGPSAGGPYTNFTSVSGVSNKSAAVRLAAPTPGTWFCAVSAVNAYGESRNSSEITFAVGFPPVAPTNTEVK